MPDTDPAPPPAAATVPASTAPSPPVPPEAAPPNPAGAVARRLFPLRFVLLGLYALCPVGACIFLLWAPNVSAELPLFVGVAVFVLLLLQAAFLCGAPHWRWPRPARRRAIAVSLAAGSLVAAALSVGVALAMLSLYERTMEQVSNLGWVAFLICAGAWAGWFAAFAVMWAAAPANGFRSVYRMLLAGSWLELLVTVPVDVQVRKRTHCYCEEGSMYALVIGITVAFWTFGPGLILLFLTRRLHRRADLRMCLRCGYDLRGLDQPRCPECGQPFEPQQAVAQQAVAQQAVAQRPAAPRPGVAATGLEDSHGQAQARPGSGAP